MKKLIPLAALVAITVTTSGCFVYERRVPARSVVVETGPATRETVITTLPTGYRTRTYSGTTYYYTRNTYYRSYPRGGYVVVPRPW
jgi:hypothetical protein